MSLINDALKRVEETQPQVGGAPGATPPPEATLKSVPARAKSSTASGWQVAVTSVMLLAALLAGAWMFLKATDSKNGVLPVRAREMNQTPAPSPEAQPNVISGAKFLPTEVQSPAAEQTARRQALESRADAQLTAADQPPGRRWDAVQPSQTEASVNVASVAAPSMATAVPRVAPTPVTPDLKLQAIIKHPKRPSAIVNGKSLFVGDSVGQYTLARVSLDSVTLRSSSGEQVLRLSK